MEQELWHHSLRGEYCFQNLTTHLLSFEFEPLEMRSRDLICDGNDLSLHCQENDHEKSRYPLSHFRNFNNRMNFHHGSRLYM